VKQKKAKRNIIFALVIIAAIISVCLYAVIQNALAPLAQREDKSVFTPKQNVVIQASTFSGDIKIQPTAGSQIEVIYQVSAPNGFLSDIKTSANQTTSDNLTTIVTSAVLQINQGVTYTASIIINVPTTGTYNFSLTTHSGNVDVQAEKANEIGVITDSGYININLPESTPFQVTASVANGKISHQGIAMDANPDSETRLKGTTTGGEGNLVMTLMSGNGDVTIAYKTQ
jgi:hypothetical protein